MQMMAIDGITLFTSVVSYFYLTTCRILSHIIKSTDKYGNAGVLDSIKCLRLYCVRQTGLNRDLRSASDLSWSRLESSD